MLVCSTITNTAKACFRHALVLLFFTFLYASPALAEPVVPGAVTADTVYDSGSLLVTSGVGVGAGSHKVTLARDVAITSQTSATAVSTAGATGTLLITGGTITNRSTTRGGAGGGSGSTITLSGGTINNTGGYGVTIINSATFNMSGGAINNSGSGRGVNGRRDTTINISGGTINNTSTGYGVENLFDSTFNMTGGIINNTGTGYGIHNTNLLNISGGTINNSGTGYGIHNLSSLNFLGGTINNSGTGNGVYNLGLGGVMAGGTINNSGTGNGVENRSSLSIHNGIISTYNMGTMTPLGGAGVFGGTAIYNHSNFITIDSGLGAGSPVNIFGNVRTTGGSIDFTLNSGDRWVISPYQAAGGAYESSTVPNLMLKGGELGFVFANVGGTVRHGAVNVGTTLFLNQDTSATLYGDSSLTVGDLVGNTYSLINTASLNNIGGGTMLDPTLSTNLNGLISVTGAMNGGGTEYKVTFGEAITAQANVRGGLFYTQAAGGSATAKAYCNSLSATAKMAEPQLAGGASSSRQKTYAALSGNALMGGATTVSSDEFLHYLSAFSAGRTAGRYTVESTLLNAGTSSVYSQIYAATASQSSTSKADGSDGNMYGVNVGMDHWMSETIMLGGLVGIASSTEDGRDSNLSKEDGTMYTLGGYGTWVPGQGTMVQGSLIVSYADRETERLDTAPIPNKFEASTHSWIYTGELNVSHSFEASNGFFITPEAGVTWMYVDSPSYSETAPGVGSVEYSATSGNYAVARLGSALAWKWQSEDESRTATPYLRAVAEVDVVEDNFTTNHNFLGVSWATSADNPDDVGAILGAGITVDGWKGLFLGAHYESRLRETSQVHSGWLEGGIKF